MTVKEFMQLDLPEFERDEILWKKKGKSKISYLPDFGTFDTETTTLKYTRNGDEHGYGLLYLWQACIFGHVVMGRYMREFFDLVVFLNKKYDLSDKRRIVLYVHNLEYDFVFLQGYFENWKIFATSKRAVLYAFTSGIEFRCSYKLTNMSLAKFLESEKTTIQKQSGADFDYHKLRTPDTELTDEELYYGYCDVLGLYQGIHSLMKKTDDNIVTIPMTSTGYVRRDCYNAMISNKKNREQFVHCQLNANQYRMCRKAFRGGNTHANRKYSGKILEDLQSFDIASSYPAVLLYNKYPCSPPVKEDFSKEKELLDVIASGKGFIAEITLKNPKTQAPIPYLAIDHCLCDILNVTNDNGRILNCDGNVTTWITDPDFNIIREQYDYDELIVNKCYTWNLDILPIELRKVISEYFVMKTKLKGVDGQEYYYGKAKNKLNGIYGMMVQDPVKDDIWVEEGYWHSKPADVEEALKTYYKSRNSFLQYQVGIYVTAYARARLQEAINICGDNIVYCDTDSVKFIRNDKISKQILDINKRIEQLALQSDVKAIEYTNKGEKQVLGLWDEEKPYVRFITYGAKKYAYEQVEKDGSIGFHITVAGLNKKLAAEEIGCIDHFVLGLTVENSGRTRAEYDDDPNPHFIYVGDVEYEIRSNVAILETTYTLGVTKDYYNLADNIHDRFERTKIKEKWTYSSRKMEVE